jgi:hypothetical protein
MSGIPSSSHQPSKPDDETFYGGYNNWGYHASGQGTITINRPTVNPLTVFYSTLRTLFRRFVLQAVYTPLEVITIITFIVTLAYVKTANHSEGKPLNVVYRQGEWLPIPADQHAHVEVVPFEHGGAFFPNFVSVCHRPKRTGECFSFRNMLAFRPNTHMVTETTTKVLMALRFFVPGGDDSLVRCLGFAYVLVTWNILLYRSRALGSSFFLPLAIVSSAALSSLIALSTAMALDIYIDPLILPWSLPFNLCLFGFGNPLNVARSVFLHPHLMIPRLIPSPHHPHGHPTHPPSPPQSPLTIPLKPTSKIIKESLSSVLPSIVGDYSFQMAIAIVAFFSSTGHFRQLSVLLALTVANNLLLTNTYFLAILGVMVEIRRIQLMKEIKATMNKSKSSPSEMLADKPGYSTRVLSFLLGQKASCVVKPGRIAIIPHPYPDSKLKLQVMVSLVFLNLLMLLLQFPSDNGDLGPPTSISVPLQ